MADLQARSAALGAALRACRSAIFQRLKSKIAVKVFKSYQLSGLVVRASALRLGGWGSIPGRVIPKTIKMGPNSSLLGAQHQGLDWGAL